MGQARLIKLWVSIENMFGGDTSRNQTGMEDARRDVFRSAGCTRLKSWHLARHIRTSLVHKTTGTFVYSVIHA